MDARETRFLTPFICVHGQFASNGIQTGQCRSFKRYSLQSIHTVLSFFVEINNEAGCQIISLTLSWPCCNLALSVQFYRSSFRNYIVSYGGFLFLTICTILFRESVNELIMPLIFQWQTLRRLAIFDFQTEKLSISLPGGRIFSPNQSDHANLIRVSD